jgi:hypothetical protein
MGSLEGLGKVICRRNGVNLLERSSFGSNRLVGARRLASPNRIEVLVFALISEKY